MRFIIFPCILVTKPKLGLMSGLPLIRVWVLSLKTSKPKQKYSTPSSLLLISWGIKTYCLSPFWKTESRTGNMSSILFLLMELWSMPLSESIIVWDTVFILNWAKSKLISATLWSYLPKETLWRKSLKLKPQPSHNIQRDCFSTKGFHLPMSIPEFIGMKILSWIKGNPLNNLTLFMTSSSGLQYWPWLSLLSLDWESFSKSFQFWFSCFSCTFTFQPIYCRLHSSHLCHICKKCKTWTSLPIPTQEASKIHGSQTFTNNRHIHWHSTALMFTLQGLSTRLSSSTWFTFSGFWFCLFATS